MTRASRFHLSYCLAAVLSMFFLVQPSWGEDETQACNPNGQPMMYGDVLADCLIDPISDVDQFQFAGSVGENVRLILTRIAGGTPCVEIRAPDNSVLVSLSCANNHKIEIPALPQSGTYHIFVSEAFNDQLATFNVSIERLFPLRSPTAIGFDDVLVDPMIMPATDLDTYNFIGKKNAEVRIIITRTGGGTPCTELRAPDNSVLLEETCVNNLDTNVVLPLAGPYQLIVTEAFNDQAATHTLSLQCISGDCGSRPPACGVNPTFAGGTLSVNATLGTPVPARWHVSLAAVGTTFRMWTAPVGVIDPPVQVPINIPGFPSLGRVALLSTLTTADGITCLNVKGVDTGPLGSRQPTPAEVESLLERASPHP